MNNLQCAIHVLTRHREARLWSDEAVALDLLAQLGLDAEGDAAHAAPVVDPALITEADVVAAEAAAHEAADKAKAARDALDAQKQSDVQAADPAPPAPAEEEVTLTARQQRAADKAAQADQANQP